MKISDHFFERWEERVGPMPPTPAMLWGIISDPGVVVVETGKVYRLANGLTYNTLSRFWNPMLQMIVSIDNIKNVAVSVLTPQALRN